MSTAHFHTGPKLLVQTNSYWDRNINISKLPLVDASTQTESSTDSRLKWTTNSAFNIATTTLIHTGTQIRTSSWWSLIQKDLTKVSKICVGTNTVKDLLVAPKDRDNTVNKGGVIYWYKCDHPGCTMEYIGKMGRHLGDRYKEHLRGPSPIFDHSQTTVHSIKLKNFSTVDRESQGITRTIKEVIYI